MPKPLNTNSNYRVGVISDTHGLLRPEAADILIGSDLIIHAGDLGNAEVLKALKEIAPLAAVRGNTDYGSWSRDLPRTDVVEIGEMRLYILHDLGQLDLDPFAAGFHAVINGHSHEPLAERKNGVLYLNPGSAGPRRFTLPVSMALLYIKSGAMDVRFCQLKV